jgi:hypothetical protein
MAAATDGDGELAVAAKVYGGDHVADIYAARDQQRSLVDHPIVELADFVVVDMIATN